MSIGQPNIGLWRGSFSQAYECVLTHSRKVPVVSSPRRICPPRHSTWSNTPINFLEVAGITFDMLSPASLPLGRTKEIHNVLLNLSILSNTLVDIWQRTRTNSLLVEMEQHLWTPMTMSRLSASFHLASNPES